MHSIFFLVPLAEAVKRDFECACVFSLGLILCYYFGSNLSPVQNRSSNHFCCCRCSHFYSKSVAMFGSGVSRLCRRQRLIIGKSELILAECEWASAISGIKWCDILCVYYVHGVSRKSILIVRFVIPFHFFYSPQSTLCVLCLKYVFHFVRPYRFFTFFLSVMRWIAPLCCLLNVPLLLVLFLLLPILFFSSIQLSWLSFVFCLYSFQ